MALHKPHSLLHNSFLLSYYFWKFINDEMALISIAGIGKGKSTVVNRKNIKISNRRHFFIYWWIFKSNSSKESCCEVEYGVYDKIHMWRISIVFFAYFDFLFDEPLKHDTYSPYISLIICIITYYPLAIFWAITFENPSINEETAAIWNYASFFCYCSCPQC